MKRIAKQRKKSLILCHCKADSKVNFTYFSIIVEDNYTKSEIQNAPLIFRFLYIFFTFVTFLELSETSVANILLKSTELKNQKPNRKELVGRQGNTHNLRTFLACTQIGNISIHLSAR